MGALKGQSTGRDMVEESLALLPGQRIAKHDGP